MKSNFKKLILVSKRKDIDFISLLIAIVLIFTPSIACQDSHEEILLPFDKIEWAKDGEHRYKMSKSIVDSNLLIGQTKTQVKYLLGKNQFKEAGNVWRYNLGIPPNQIGFAEYEVLDIFFSGEKVTSVNVHFS